jgi:copper oxidase (laccase) domain-containing protein
MLKLTADCLPVALARARGRPALAVLHVGRMGLLAGVVAAGAAAVDGGPTAAVVGPGIGPCCYEVGDEIRAAYRARFGASVIRGRNLDLWTAVERALRDAGVRSVDRTDVCTACNPREYFSHRRDGGVTGRQGVIGYVA